MRKYIILYIALCLHIAARGQTIADIDLSWLPQPTQAKALRYWIDDDIGSMQTTSVLNGQHTVDVSSLLGGLHTIHYQIVDNEDKVSVPYSGIFLKTEESLSDSEAATLRYWFDDDAASVQAADYSSVQMLDVSSLLDGLHCIHWQLIDTDGSAASTASTLFLKMGSSHEGEGIKASKLMYWFDDETTIQYVDVTDGVQMLDASCLMEGLHTLHYQVLCNNGQMTPATSSLFLRLSIDVETTTAKSFRYWFDDGQTATEVEITDGVQVLDASPLTEGLHTVHYQIVDSSGMLGAPASSLFLKIGCDTDTVIAKSIRYWFDDDAAAVNVIDVSNGTQTLEVADMPSGLHTLNYQLIDSKGNVGVPVTRIFMKSFDTVMASGHNSIIKYQYWQNSNSAMAQTVAIDEPVNPYTLIALLPMQRVPFRSSCFHFEVKDGKPMAYAKNDFHVRFTDAAGYFVDDSRPFTDYSVSKEVVPVGELQASQTFDRIAENDVRWYTMQAAPGDTTAFKLSQPATIQVFAPSGAEVFKTAESASTKWSGIHTWEEGTYYVAVHDVTGSQSTMKLEYMHMDKYDVVDWDVHTVGDGGCSTITFKGNGFRDLYAVDLVVAPGDTIHCVDVSHDSDAETAVTFDFTDATLGDYSAVFHFTEEDKHVANVVTVEEARDIELATDVSFPSSFLRGTSTTYTIKITNKGNMTAYRVPIYVNMETSRQEDITHIEISGLKLPPVFSKISRDSISKEDLAWLENLQEQIGDAHYFNGSDLYNELLQYNQYVQSANFYSNISPGSQKVISVTVCASAPIDVRVYVPEEYSPLFKQRSSLRDGFCCYREKIECAANVFADISGIADDIVEYIPGCPYKAATAAANCIFGTLNQFVKASGSVFCDDNSEEKNFWDNVKGVLDGMSLMETISTCASRFLPAGKFKDIMKVFADGNKYTKAVDAFSIGVDVGDCLRLLFEKKPACPSNLSGGGGTSTPFVPRDPNDIYGYLSESGSKFIADSVARVNYTIEFENDTAFATAAAHTIVIRDTLASPYFDLTKFMPTGVRIGEKETSIDVADVVSEGNVTSFVKTIDMRPEIYAIAQVDGTFNAQTRIAEWRFTSLDPMTMEPTDDLMQGILPVNFDGTSGIGEVMFEVGVKQGKADGTEIRNRAGIVFDYEAQILTPTWTNIVDAVPPTSNVESTSMEKADTVTLHFTGEDNRSGIWRYTIYVQDGVNAPWRELGVTDSCAYDFAYAENFDYGFCVLATDSAGNVERKELVREAELRSFIAGDANSDGIVDTKDAVLVISYYLGKQGTYLNASAADIVEDGVIDTKDAVAIIDKYLNTSGKSNMKKNRRRIKVL